MVLIVGSRIHRGAQKGGAVGSVLSGAIMCGAVAGAPPVDLSRQAHPDRPQEDHVDDQIAEREPGDIPRLRHRRVIDHAEDEVHPDVMNQTHADEDRCERPIAVYEQECEPGQQCQVAGLAEYDHVEKLAEEPDRATIQGIIENPAPSPDELSRGMSTSGT